MSRTVTLPEPADTDTAKTEMVRQCPVPDEPFRMSCRRFHPPLQTRLLLKTLQSPPVDRSQLNANSSAAVKHSHSRWQKSQSLHARSGGAVIYKRDGLPAFLANLLPSSSLSLLAQEEHSASVVFHVAGWGNVRG